MNMRFVFTGGPGSGKTTLLETLHQQSLCTVPEVARALIRERNRAGLPPRPPPREFACAILQADIHNYHRTPAKQVSLFDRGIVDALAMAKQCGAIPAAYIDLLSRNFRYHKQVFLFPPWRDIYVTDNERDQTFAEAQEIYAQMRAWYVRCGYQPVEVPVGNISQRQSFVLSHIHALSKS
ncbi:MAG: ATP-binding protein [Pseudomonadota bacterium]